MMAILKDRKVKTIYMKKINWDEANVKSGGLRQFTQVF
jgi:hypothetical protein